MSVSTVIIKPTKMCNAECTYCAAPPEVNGGEKWSIDDFKRIFDNIHPYLTEKAVLIWHGGEPMLMGPDFYWKAWEYARSVKPEIVFSMQTNILGYDSRRWKDVFTDVMQTRISTSFDPDEQFRVYKGSTSLYTRIFYDRLEKMIEDNIIPKVIGTYSEETAHLSEMMYDKAASYGDKAFNLRFNYRYPAGRDSGKGELITPDTYGKMITKLYNRWIQELPSFTITPLDEMLKKTIGLEAKRCPWTRECGGHFFGIEPNGDVYNCSEFADLDDPEYCFGNAFSMTGDELLKSRAATLIRRRRVNVPSDCLTCRHFEECEGGCMRDSVLYGRGLGGKFYYCWSWKMTFDRIKESIRTGEADGAIVKYGYDPENVRKQANIYRIHDAA